AATGRPTTRVVGSGALVGTAEPPTRTFRTTSCAPTRCWAGMFGQRRRTIRSVGCSGANEMREVPRTTFRLGAIVTVSAYVGRLGGGGGSAPAAGQPLSAADR